MNRVSLSTKTSVLSWKHNILLSLSKGRIRSQHHGSLRNIQTTFWIRNGSRMNLPITKRTIISSLFSNNSDANNDNDDYTKRYQIMNHIIPTHPIHLFNIIVDVDSYHEFLPFCTDSQILQGTTTTIPNQQYQPHEKQQQQQQQQKTITSSTQMKISHNEITTFEASMTIGFPPFIQETYISKVMIHPADLICETRSIKGQLFHSLYSKWHLRYYQTTESSSKHNIKHSKNNGSRCHTIVNFEVAIASHDPIILHTLDQVLEKVAKQQIQAFEQRCHQIPFHYDQHHP